MVVASRTFFNDMQQGVEVELRVGRQVGAHWGALFMKKLCGKFNFFIESTGTRTTFNKTRKAGYKILVLFKVVLVTEGESLKNI